MPPTGTSTRVRRRQRRGTYGNGFRTVVALLLLVPPRFVCNVLALSASSKPTRQRLPVSQPAQPAHQQQMPQDKVLQNWVSIVGHLQNPQLYSAAWADQAMLVEHGRDVDENDREEKDGSSRQHPIVPSSSRRRRRLDHKKTATTAKFRQRGEQKRGRPCLVAKRDVTAGQILSLVPIQGLRLVPSFFHNNNNNNNNNNNDDSSNTNIPSENDAISSSSSTRGPSFCFSPDMTRPHEYHRPFFSSLTAAAVATTAPTQSVVVVDAPSSSSWPDAVDGWLGHLAATTTTTATTTTKATSGSTAATPTNCRVVPLIGAMPLCALVATRPVAAQEPLVMSIGHADDDSDDDDAPNLRDLTIQVLQRYIAEISELRSYATMAHPFPTYQSPRPVLPSSKRGSFHQIDTDYPRLAAIHRSPDVYQVDEFLTEEECRAIIEVARPKLQPCLVKNADTGRVEADPTRTSTNANIPQAALPSVTNKIRQLLACPSSQYLETFQVLRYTAGQTFLPHTDGFEGPVDACGFENSGRLVTLFCYLNTVKAGDGGETCFTQISSRSGDESKRSDTFDDALKLGPVQGRAAVHFPNSLELHEDVRTEHTSLPMVRGEKWLLVTWLWKDARSDPAYHEALIR